ncbi:MAG TPA: hypothetical protein PLH19_06445 [Anaerolineae bacterium]|nr:hypothetical protein [Anaerolineae bacterium]HQH38160.1 hypothetical protein [Anaerolineae bacterium]
MKMKNLFTFDSRRGISSLWRIMTSIVLCSIVLFPMPTALYSAPTVWPAPVLVEPADGITTTVLNYPPTAVPLFVWEPVTGATQYRLQIDDQIGFNEPLLYNVTTSNIRYIPIQNSNLLDGPIYWRVRVEKPTPVGEWSFVRQFTKDWGTTGNAPLLSAPANGATIEFFEAPIFSWSPVVGAADYVLRIDNDFDCLSPASQYTTLATSYNLSTRLANGTYYWCVMPRDAASRNGLLSEVRQFTVGYAQIPQLLEPANGSKPAYTPAFRWTAVKGAVAYRLQHSTDPTFVSGLTTVTTEQTTYTPEDSFPNDETRYWRVAALYGNNWVGPYSEAWSFQKKWYHQPVLLTPLNNELTNAPLFTWTPVREARRYHWEVSYDIGFASTLWTADTANTFHEQINWKGDEWDKTIYWRVTPYDQDGNVGVSSEVKSFRPVEPPAIPENIWPRYFYAPPSVASGNYAPPRDIPISYDYTVDTPTFYWSRTFVPGVEPREEATYYGLEVDDDPNFGSPEWTVLTQNLSATPTEGNPFTPTANTNYYWRVTPYAAAGTVLTGSLTNQPSLTQIDVTRRPRAAATTAPLLLAPQHGEKVFATLPSFEWQAQKDALRYEIELSNDPAFSTTAYLTRTTYTHHTPVVRLPIGTYFWRVRGLDSSGNTVGTWSATRRLIVAMQTRWLGIGTYGLGSLPSQYDSLMAMDPDEGLGAAELTSLYVAQDKDNWFVGFHINPTTGTSMIYGLYLDGNQAEGQGASFAPANRPALTTSSYYQPEYALYVTYNGTALDTGYIPVYTWITNTLSWDPQIKNLVDIGQIGGAIFYSSTIQYVELRLPKTAIGDRGDKPFSLSAVLFSATANEATTAADTVPDNGVSPSILREFKTIGDRVTLAMPIGELPEERPPLLYSPYLYAESPKTDLLGGYELEVARDPGFTSVVQSMQAKWKGCELYPDIFLYLYTTLNIYEDNTLYWRYRIRHKLNDVYYNAPPSEPQVFTKSGPTPGNLRTAGTYSTPKFIWDAVEGAANYQFESATNPEFSQNVLRKDVNHESYTPLEAYQAGTYYWRVRAENSLVLPYASDWSPVSTLIITLPQPSLVEPPIGGVIHSSPTFRWEASLLPGDTTTVGWTAAKYRLQVANNPNFSSPIENFVLDTITWTPAKTYADGDYYWRVAVVDANGKDGPFSGVYTFTKQYPAPTLISPLPGMEVSAGFPTFIWEPITTTSVCHYRIEIAQNPQFSPLINSETTDNAIFTPLKTYTAKEYYWRVAMIDKSGSYGPWTDSVLIDAYPYDIFLPLTLRNKK